ncbi:MAG: cytochrome-c peroxidase [Acidobacteriota bacterium]
MKYAILLALVLVGCGRGVPERKRVIVTGALGLPPLEMPEAGAAEVALGKRLFFDPKLSADGRVACASCHDPQHGFADPKPVSEGVGGRRGRRNAPTVLNAAYWRTQFWDGRAPSLEQQARGPITNELEMAHEPAKLMAKLKADGEYVEAFGGREITMEAVVEAIAAYERTLLSGNSAADRYLYGGDKTALGEEAILGLKVFRQHCVSCHMIGREHGLFTDHEFHNIGIGVNAVGELTDLGQSKGRFRTPSLRNVARTAPYMHDGSLKTLRQVVDYYVGGGNSNPHLDARIRPLALSGAERAGLVAFLESLNGEMPQ